MAKAPAENFTAEHFTIDPETCLLECLRRLDRTGCHILVCIEESSVTGVVSEGDIRRGLINGMALDQPVGPLINRAPVVVSTPYDPETVIALMRKQRIDGIPAINEKGEFVEFLTFSSLMRQKDRPNTAVIMAGGKGIRLRPLTMETPKPLLPVAGRPMIEHVIEQLAGEGIRRFIVTINYLADKFSEILGDGSHLNVEISYIREDEPLGTLGSLGLIDHSELSAPLLVTNGDVLARLNLDSFLQHHEASRADLTVCVKEYSHLVPYGVVNVEDDAIIELEEKPEKNFIINAGIYCVNPGVLHLIPGNRALDFPEFLRLLLENGRSVSSYLFNGYWRDVGTIEDYSRANIELREFLNAAD